MTFRSVVRGTLSVSLAAGFTGLFSGCAGGMSGNNNPGSQNQGCSAYMAIGPASGTADHAAMSPGNQVQFQAYSGESCTNGATPAVVALVYAGWSNPDPLDVQISSAADMTNGLATCKNTTAGPVTLTATATIDSKQYQQNAQLTCK
jgi:hypothetical protein